MEKAMEILVISLIAAFFAIVVLIVYLYIRLRSRSIDRQFDKCEYEEYDDDGDYNYDLEPISSFVLPKIRNTYDEEEDFSYHDDLDAEIDAILKEIEGHGKAPEEVPVENDIMPKKKDDVDEI